MKLKEAIFLTIIACSIPSLSKAIGTSTQNFSEKIIRIIEKEPIDSSLWYLCDEIVTGCDNGKIFYLNDCASHNIQKFLDQLEKGDFDEMDQNHSDYPIISDDPLSIDDLFEATDENNEDVYLEQAFKFAWDILQGGKIVGMIFEESQMPLSKELDNIWISIYPECTSETLQKIQDFLEQIAEPPCLDKKGKEVKIDCNPKKNNIPDFERWDRSLELDFQIFESPYQWKNPFHIKNKKPDKIPPKPKIKINKTKTTGLLA